MNSRLHNTGASRLRALAAGTLSVLATLVVVLGAQSVGQLDDAEAAPQPAAGAGRAWVGTWGTSLHQSFNPGFDDVTLRMVVRTSTAGESVRIRLANTFGNEPLQVGAATVGLQQQGAEIAAGSNRRLTFGGKPSVTVPEGAQIVSDPVAMDVPRLTNLAVSLYLSTGSNGATTQHLNSNQTSYVSIPGDHSGDRGAANFPITTKDWSYLQGVDVQRPNGATIVALGDSITAGGQTTWPEVLAERLQNAPQYHDLGVLNEGIGASELLRRAALFGLSQPGITRMDRDVLLQSNVRAAIVLMGTNDILGGHRASAEQVIAGLQQLVAKAKDQDVRVIGGTITPCSCYGSEQERHREAVNEWIRTSEAFDGVVDFDRALRDPANTHRMDPAYHDPGDPLHPNAEGYRVMGNSIPLTLLSPQ
ncbi:GDSL-type esterase/lipase family protein [Kribbella turkmenica]|nr:GDSL-type esterase/lipase family protein [Kribbella turkmenica]